MAKTLVQIRAEIRQLEKQAESVRAREVAGVVARIKEAIGFYELKVEDLFGAKPARTARAVKAGGKAPRKAVRKSAGVARYRDPASGKTWTGHGKRPGWFAQALAEGRKAEDLAIAS